ncbi:hypothetical protein [Chryseobacterium sp. GP-SGM7]|uniref:hypothetical protein n=1 Tax=Chryseobacterium sp. GP-SGM7 TaxID=3411323 RepID=UPI003B939B2C
MKKSQFILVNQLKEKLQDFRMIVTSLETKEPSFLEKIFSWLKSTEDIFSTNNISEVSEIAGLRSKILTAKFSDERGSNIRKNQIKVAAGILYNAQNTVLNILMPYEQKINDCKEITKQLLALTAQTEIQKYNKNIKFEDYVTIVWHYIISDNNLKVGAVKLKSILSEMDILMVIADEIDLEEFS